MKWCASWYRAVGLSVALCSTLCYTPPASACAGPECLPPVRLPGLTSMPGNLVYFQVSSDDPGVLALRTAAGDPIAANTRMLGGDRVFAPDAPIPANTDVVLEYREHCYDGPASESSTFSFHTTEAAEIELRPALLTLEEQGTLFQGDQVAAAFIRLRHQGPVANAALLPLLSSQVWVDGDFEHVQPSELELLMRCGSSQLDLGFDTCGESPLVVLPGKHTIEVRSHLVGQATQPEPARLDVELHCPASTVPPENGDAGAVDAGTGTAQDGSGAREDAGTGVPAARDTREPEGSDVIPPVAPAASHRDSGCALRHPESPRQSPLLAALTLALAMLGIRARRRRWLDR